MISVGLFIWWRYLNERWWYKLCPEFCHGLSNGVSVALMLPSSVSQTLSMVRKITPDGSVGVYHLNWRMNLFSRTFVLISVVLYYHISMMYCNCRSPAVWMYVTCNCRTWRVQSMMEMWKTTPRVRVNQQSQSKGIELCTIHRLRRQEGEILWIQCIALGNCNVWGLLRCDWWCTSYTTQFRILYVR